MRYRLFRRKSSNLYYFQFLEGDDAILNSQGYQDKEARNNGLSSIFTNVSNLERYSVIEDEGKFHFILRAGNNQEIGRSIGFPTRNDAQSAINAFREEASGLQEDGEGGSSATTTVTTTTVSATGELEAPYQDSGKSDNYHRLSFYQSNIGNGINGFVTFEAEGKHWFTYNVNGVIYLISEGYESSGARDNGIESVTTNMSKEDRYQLEQHPNGAYYFNLRAGNNREIATSRWFTLESDRSASTRMLMTGQGASLQEGVQLQAANRIAGINIADAPMPVEKKPKKKRKKRENTKPKAEKVIVREGTYHFNDITYQLFRSGNERYYFTFRNAEGKALFLNSSVRGFETQEQAEEVIDQIMNYAPYESNFEGKTTRNNKFYFYIKGEEGKNIGKSFFYDTTEIMQKSVGTLLGTETQLGALERAGGGRATKNIDEYLDCAEYAGAAGFHAFRHDSNNEYYFGYNSNNGKTLLRSEGYTTSGARDNGIESVKKNSPIDTRWKTDIEENGKYFYALRAGNNQEIARSCPYDSQDAMMGSYRLLTGEGSQLGFGSQVINGVMMSALAIRQADEAKAARIAAEEKMRREAEEARRLAAEAEAARKAEEEARLKAEAEKARLAAEAEAARNAEAERLAAAEAEAARRRELRLDDYLSCAAYKGGARNDFHTFMEGGEHYFSYIDGNGEVLLRSEGYKSPAARDNGIESVKKNAPLEDRWTRGTAMNAKYHFYALKAGNNQEIARSCYYKDNASMLAAYGAVTNEKSKIGFGAMAVNGLMMSAFGFRQQQEAEAAAARKAEEARLAAEAEAKRKAEERLAAEAAAQKQAAAEAARRKELRLDDYLACVEYKGGEDNEFHKFKKEGEEYFSYIGDNEEVLLRSEGYKSIGARDNGIQSVIKNAPIEERWKQGEAMNGKYHYYALFAANHQEIARSCYYKDRAAMLAAFGMMTGEKSRLGYGSALVGGTMMSLAMLTRQKEEVASAESARLKAEQEIAALAARRKKEAEEKAAAAALAARRKKEEEEKVAALAAARKKEEDEDEKKAKAAAAAATGLALKLKKEEEEKAAAAAVLAATRKKEEDAKKAKAVAVAAATAAAALAAKEKAAAVKKEKAAAAAAAVTSEKAAAAAAAGGCMKFLPWLLGLLALAALLYFMRGCFGCDKAAVVAPPAMEETAKVETPAVDTAGDAAAAALAAREKAERDAAAAATCNCTAATHPVFDLPSGKTPKTLTRLGTNPEFGNSHSLDPAGFYNKLKKRHQQSGTDTRFLDGMFRAMGYANGFADANASMFSNVKLNRGQVGNIGYGSKHGTLYAKLNVSDRDLQAFKIKAANGCDAQFMKTCGNHFFYCPK